MDKSTGLICDQTIVLTGPKSKKLYPKALRLVRFKDQESGKVYTFLNNDFMLPALTIPELYKSRWKVELFFRWIKQHLRIKAFYGTSENAVKTQIWIAISAYVLVAIAKKKLELERDLYTLLQILNVTLSRKCRSDKHLPDRPTLPKVAIFTTSCSSSTYDRTLLAESAVTLNRLYIAFNVKLY